MSIFKIHTLCKSTWNLKDISLRATSRELEPNEISSPWLKKVISDMFETLYSTPSGVGLAASQVGIQLKLIVVDIRRDAKKPIVLINPQYIPTTTDMQESIEGCLSVPGFRGVVKRYSSIKLKYININGNIVEKDINGFESFVYQHEIDHLNGILYIDKLFGNNLKEDFGHPHKMAIKAYDKIMEVSNNDKKG